MCRPSVSSFTQICLKKYGGWGINSWKPLSKIWHSLNQFSRDAQLFGTDLWRPSVSNLAPIGTKNMEISGINSWTALSKIWLSLSQFSRDAEVLEVLQRIPYNISWKSDIPFSSWCCMTDGRTDGRCLYIRLSSLLFVKNALRRTRNTNSHTSNTLLNSLSAETQTTSSHSTSPSTDQWQCLLYSTNQKTNYYHSSTFIILPQLVS
jgi:hypothetical protein